MRVGGMVGERERRRSQSLEVLGLRAARPRRRLPLLSRIVWRHTCMHMCMCICVAD